MTRLFILVFLTSAAWAESSRGYFFVAPGGRSAGGHTEATYSIGGGGELMLDRGVGVGAELQGVVPAHGAASGTFGIFSLNGYFHPLQARRDTTKLDPFVTVGYSLAFRTSTANLWNFGGGLNYWLRDRIALMAEVRDHPWHTDRTTAHYWGIRIGLSFR